MQTDLELLDIDGRLHRGDMCGKVDVKPVCIDTRAHLAVFSPNLRGGHWSKLGDECGGGDWGKACSGAHRVGYQIISAAT